MSTDIFRLHTLGCGSAKPTLSHQPSCSVLEKGNRLFMFDCGEGAQSAFIRQGLKFSRLEHIFLTHLHGDHVFGLPGLIGTLALSNIGKPLTVHTFEEGAEMLHDIITYFNHDLTFDLKFNIIEPSERMVFEDNNIRISTVPLKHKIPSVGYIVEEKEGERHLDIDSCLKYEIPAREYKGIKNGSDYILPSGDSLPNELLTFPPTPPRKYAHISDTSYLPELAERIQNVDLLFHETTYLRSHTKEAHERGHSTSYEAGMLARDASAHQLLTGHYSSRYTDDTLFVKEAMEVFTPALLNYEGRITEIPRKKV